MHITGRNELLPYVEMYWGLPYLTHLSSPVHSHSSLATYNHHRALPTTALDQPHVPFQWSKSSPGYAHPSGDPGAAAWDDHSHRGYPAARMFDLCRSPCH